MAIITSGQILFFLVLILAIVDVVVKTVVKNLQKFKKNENG